MNEVKPRAELNGSRRWSAVVFRAVYAGVIMGLLIGVSNGLGKVTHQWWLPHLGKICAIVVLIGAIRGVFKKPQQSKDDGPAA